MTAIERTAYPRFTRAMHTSAQVMNNPADLINAAIEMLLAEHCELPAFSTLAGRRLYSFDFSGLSTSRLI